MSHIPDAGTVITALTIAAGFSLLIERGIEAFKYIVNISSASSADPLIVATRENNNIITHKNLQKLSLALDEYEKNPNDLSHFTSLNTQDTEQSPNKTTDTVDNDFDEDEAHFENNPAIVLKKIEKPKPKELIDKKMQIFFLLSAFAIGVIIASCMNIHLLTLLMGKDPQVVSNLQLLTDEILTGLVIAGGSHPIHVLLKFITTRKVPTLSETDENTFENTEAEVLQHTGATPSQFNAAVAIPEPSIDNTSQWTPIDYHGGVKPASLENRNHRAGNPNLIVYHHTAMNSKLGFQAVVDEFLVTKKWSTGYHCVVMPDGAIKPFCRWDRVGNHTKGLNNQSLGIAFHGNFHSDVGDHYSNHDGRFGNLKPTQAQLIAGARLVALWVHLYADIKLDFDNHILPHKGAKPGYTVCPGSHFPYQDFNKKVEQLYQKWMASNYAMQQIDAFKNKPYLYV